MPAENQVIDIHCHPCLKTWLFPSHHVYDNVYPADLKFSENCFVNIPQMNQGNVGIAVSVYYIPETELNTEPMKNFIFRNLLELLDLFCTRLDIILEDKSSANASFLQILSYIRLFENDIAYARDTLGKQVDIARSYDDLQAKINDGTTVFLHSIEGAHALGNGDITEAQLVANLEQLAALGLCQITIGHFFQNILVSSSGGMPPGLATDISYSPDNYNTYENGYNSELVQNIIAKMLDLGIIIDLVHSHPGAKAMVYAVNDARAVKRPLVFAHTGIREVALQYNDAMPDAYANFLPDADDIRAIKDCGGVLGLIFMDYWLTGNDGTGPDIPALIKCIEFIRDVADSTGNSGTYEHIAIGSDLDGFTTIPRDLAGENQMPALVNAISEIPGITADQIDQICWANYMRVLRNGWGAV
jgi:microsomal dipeptidase-like Zn-dependent dipeptidase